MCPLSPQWGWYHVIIEVYCLLIVRGGGAIKYGVSCPGGSASESGVLIEEGVEVV